MDDNGAPKTGVLNNGLVNTLKNNTIKCKNLAFNFNNCFGSEKRSTTLLQAKTGQHECRNVTATHKTKYNGKI